MNMASDLVASGWRSVAGQRPCDQLSPRARPTVWPGRRRVPGIVVPESGGARGADCLPLRRPPPPASAGLPVWVGMACRSLCPHSGSGTTEARPSANGALPLCLMGERGSCRAHRHLGQFGFRSLHPGGANFAMADGSVKFVKDSINLSTYGILIALTHYNASGSAASRFRNVEVRNWSGSRAGGVGRSAHRPASRERTPSDGGRSLRSRSPVPPGW
jgi:prepilin-type processing-associated H-X9-DG protein